MYSVIHYVLSQWQGILAIIFVIVGLLVFIHGIQCSSNTTFGSNKEHRHSYQAGGIILVLAGTIALVITIVLSQQPISAEKHHQINQQINKAPKHLKPQLQAYLKRHPKMTRMDYHNFQSLYQQLHHEYKTNNQHSQTQMSNAF